MSLFPSNNDFLKEVRQQEGSLDPNDPEIGGHCEEAVKGEETRSDEKQLFSYLYFHKKEPEDCPQQEISFQKNFLAQHIKTVSLILQKSREFMPALTASLPVQSPHDLLPSASLYSSQSSTQSFIKTWIPPAPGITHEEFIKDLRKQTDLDEFLNYLIGHYSRPVATPLLVLAIDIWSELRTRSLKELEIGDFRRVAATFALVNQHRYFQRSDFSSLLPVACCSESADTQCQLLPAFKTLVRRFVLTICLIVGGFFENPHAIGNCNPEDQNEVDYPKRQFSSVSIGFMSYQDMFLQSQFSLEPEKKLKLE